MICKLLVVACGLALLAGCSSDDKKQTAESVELKLGDFAVRAVLTLPPSVSKAPAIVMMGGSGPSDADETIGALKPFRDIADGLAANGVATLRYSKSAVRALETKRFTPTDEYQPDAVAALELLSHRDDIDATRIFLLGHSLGGTMAPRVASAEPRFRGVILMAAATPDLAAHVVRQVAYMTSIGQASPDSIQAANAFAAEVDAPGLQPDSAISSPLAGGATGAYFLDLRNYNAVATARALPVPMLLLQGDRDYQVTVDHDLAAWTAGLSGKTDVTIIRYPKAGHAFVDRSGPPSPTDYTSPGKVATKVITDIAAWINSH